MALNINGTTGISGVDGTVSAPALTGTDSNTGITFPSADTIKFSTGGVERLSITNSGVTGTGVGGAMKQLKSVTKTSTTSTTSTSYTDISGMSVTLTPESGTKCYVTYHVIVGVAAGYSAGIQLLRDSTAIGNGDQYNANNYYNSRGGFLNTHATYLMGGNMDFGFLDTHGADGSTAVTYKLQFISPYGVNIYLNRAGNAHSNTTGEANYHCSTLTVMEVAA
tara:strand:- start:28954 stop:29619 length:666 start_codon:yes stop_codon:yes gene_type:complete